MSRQQVLPQKDPKSRLRSKRISCVEVFVFKGARATGIDDGDEVVVSCDDGRIARGSHALLAIGSIPNSDGLNLASAGVETDGGYVPVDRHMQSNVPHIYAAGDLSGRLPLSSVATMQGRKIAEHALGMYSHAADREIDYDKAASAIFTEPEIADVGLAEIDAFAEDARFDNKFRSRLMPRR